MSETLPREEFEHFHQDGLKNLELEKAKLEAEGRVQELEPFDGELKSTVDSAIKALGGSARGDPERVFAIALSALSDLDAKRFLLDNLLEALKSGKSVQDAMGRYKALGLVTEAPSPNNVTENLQAVGKGLIRRKGILRRITTAVVQIAVNAFKSIPKWVEIEPQLMLVGPVPVLGFVLKGKSMSIQELFETLRGTEE